MSLLRFNNSMFSSFSWFVVVVLMLIFQVIFSQLTLWFIRFYKETPWLFFSSFIVVGWRRCSWNRIDSNSWTNWEDHWL
jgi:hypothetical protein